jgi:hypothetical protein
VVREPGARKCVRAVCAGIRERFRAMYETVLCRREWGSILGGVIAVRAVLETVLVCVKTYGRM